MNQEKMAIKAGKNIWSQTGSCHDALPERLRPPRMAPAAKMEPVNQKVLQYAVTTARHDG